MHYTHHIGKFNQYKYGEQCTYLYNVVMHLQFT